VDNFVHFCDLHKLVLDIYTTKIAVGREILPLTVGVNGRLLGENASTSV